MTQPVRIASDLFESARRTGAAQERSAAQQLSYWARIGREIEASSAIGVAENARLADAATYDEMPPTHQALVRAQWETGMKDAIAGLDLRARFAAEGRTYAVVGDAKGGARDVDIAAPRATKRATKKKPATKKAARRVKA
ncbi:MAG: hypothetical protein QOK28_901 [Actinomycetota bacterium]|jgi:hypothetical protein